MKEFNYERAHREWAVPEYNKLSTEIKDLFRRVQQEGQSWKQDDGTSIKWPNDNIKAAFDAIPSDQLSYGMQVIYGLGHWDYPESGCAKDKHGAYWKFEILAKRSLVERTPYHPWTELKIADSFMDHKEGTEYSCDEIPDLVRSVCCIYSPIEADAVNFKVNGRPGHSFMTGNGHFVKDSIYLDPTAHGCYHKDLDNELCGRPYSEHTHDVALFVRGPIPETEEERAEIVAIVDVCKKYNAKVDGIAFIEPKTEKSNDR